jgi:Subtilase family
MPTDERRLILANGEKLVDKTDKTGHGRPAPLPRLYDDARDRVVDQVKATLRGAEGLGITRRYKDELFLCFRLHPDMLAKSYEPETLFVEVPDLKKVGSRNWRPKLEEVAQTDRVKKQRAGERDAVGLSRLIFVQGNEEGYQRLLTKLDRSTRLLSKQFQDDICKIERVDLLTPEEQLQGFRDGWERGRVEIVLHPSGGGQDKQSHFLEALFKEMDVASDKRRTAFYGAGPGFVSAVLTKSSLQMLRGCNPLRTVHPMECKGLADLRTSKPFKAPPPPNGGFRSTIKVGLIDGGVDVNCPHLKGFVEEDAALGIKTKAMAAFVSHGTAVAGAVLYGSLDKHDPDKPLPTPPVSVVSIRAFPPSATGDIDLYECIDVIENAVPARPDISVFNISFGPIGPIADDTISRFTYALDQLAINHNVLFFVAVGNDGDDPKYHRIKAPSDMVHGIGVGAYTVRKGVRLRAPYSCKGPGREGGKIKPDFVSFGGCGITPIHLVSLTHGMKILESGTSFASPSAASLGAQANGLYDRATTLLTRALLTHCSVHPGKTADHEIGHGYLVDTVEDILNCSSKAVTIAYQGEVLPKTFYKLVIPVPESIEIPGNIEISWTVAAKCPVEFDHPGDYTSCCIEDTFYPHDNIFSFGAEDASGKQVSKRLNLVTDKSEIAALGKAWKRSEFPASRSGNVYPTEQEKRAVEYKWDTVVRRTVSLRASSLHKPFLVLHAIARHAQLNRFPYAAVVTISAPKIKTDLHNEIVRRYPVLQPIRVRTEAEIRVRV